MHFFLFSIFFLILNQKKNEKPASIYRLDQILGKQGSKAKDVYASKISLASRVVKVERSVCVWLIEKKILYQFGYAA